MYLIESKGFSSFLFSFVSFFIKTSVEYVSLSILYRIWLPSELSLTFIRVYGSLPNKFPMFVTGSVSFIFLLFHFNFFYYLTM